MDVRLWGDERVRRLSRSAPSGLVCWLYLLTAKESTALPGAIPAGPAALAESLGWPRSAFLRCFGETVDLGMAKADWDAGLAWLPDALRYNPPQSPNAVKAWAKAWDELPECDLKREIREHVEEYLRAKGEAFAEAFGGTIPDPEAEADSEDEQETGEGSAGTSSPDATEAAALLRALWNDEVDPKLPRWKGDVADSRKRLAARALQRRAPDEWREVFRRINASAFCRGANERGWTADLDWALRPDGRKPESATLVLEGRFDGKGSPQAPATRPVKADEDLYPDEDLRA